MEKGQKVKMPTPEKSEAYWQERATVRKPIIWILGTLWLASLAFFPSWLFFVSLIASVATLEYVSIVFAIKKARTRELKPPAKTEIEPEKTNL